MNQTTRPCKCRKCGKDFEAPVQSRHRVLCGDSMNAEDFAKLMGGQKAAMVFTDPPWNVAIGGDGNPRHRQREGLKNDDLSPEEFAAFLDKFAGNMKGHITGDVYCFLGASEWPTLDLALRRNGYHWSATIIWVKDAFVLGRSKYHRRYEPIWYGWHKDGKSSFCDKRDLDDVWEVPRPKRSEEHPTMKPVELAVRAISNSSLPGDGVLDPFGGSGSTLIGCEQTGRKAFLMEIDPLYADTICERYFRFTGKSPVRESDGVEWSVLHSSRDLAGPSVPAEQFAGQKAANESDMTKSAPAVGTRALVEAMA